MRVEKILTKNYKHRYSEVKYFMDKKNAGDISMKRFYCQLYCYSTSDEINRSHRIWCLVTNKLFFPFPPAVFCSLAL